MERTKITNTEAYTMFNGSTVLFKKINKVAKGVFFEDTQHNVSFVNMEIWDDNEGEYIPFRITLREFLKLMPKVITL